MAEEITSGLIYTQIDGSDTFFRTKVTFDETRVRKNEIHQSVSEDDYNNLSSDQKGGEGDGFYFQIVKIDDDKTKHITFRYLKGRNKVRFPPQIGAKGNPVFMLFFERDARDMQRLTGGNALFFRSRIRHSIAATDVEDIEFKFNGENYSGKQISFQPFLKTELKNRVSRYKTKKFVVTLSEDIPGYIYKIETFIKDLDDPDDMVKETLIFQGMRTNKQLRDAYKNRKENS